MRPLLVVVTPTVWLYPFSHNHKRIDKCPIPWAEHLSRLNRTLWPLGIVRTPARTPPPRCDCPR